MTSQNIEQPKRFSVSGLPCEIRRSQKTDSYCGYVGFFKGHPMYGRECSAGAFFFDAYGRDGKLDELRIDHLQDEVGSDVWWFFVDFGYANNAHQRYSDINLLVRKTAELARALNY